MMISAVLARSMPRKAVLEMMLTGRLITPEEALRWGAVSRVVARDELDDAVSETVAALGALSQAALMLGKDSFYGVTDLDFDTSLDRLQGGLTEIALTDDAGEGVRAFVEKRPPEWSGR
jgi:enoyl-CoA hydratase/carnithine racemase